MSQKLWSGLTAATLLITTLGVAPLSYADQPRSEDSTSDAQVPNEERPANQVASNPSSPAPEPTSQSDEVVKVGEYQSEEQAEPDDAITEIFPHEVEGRQAATLYVRNIPVLTFLGSDASASTQNSSELADGNAGEDEVKVASIQNHSQDNYTTQVATSRSNRSVTGNAAGTENAEDDSSDPVWQATAIAARLNQLYRDNVDAESITAVWDPQQQSYLVRIGDNELVAMSPTTVLPNSTRDLGEDTLQVTNLLRRLLGDAPPLQSVSGEPQDSTRISLGPLQFSVSGWASWYGPGFDGNYSASGEVFNQNALTAAHRTLPFGTQVRVTNMDNGLSVVVRINDRGPFHGDRVIDLSTAAAEAIGLVQSGVAPVNVEVLGTTQASNSVEN
jgi:rare lipoprotein A